MDEKQIRRNRRRRRGRRRRGHRRRRLLIHAGADFLRSAENFIRNRPKTAAAILIAVIILYVVVMEVFAFKGMISTKGDAKTEHENTVKATETTEVATSDLTGDEEPFNTMSQDWSGEDMEGFCYHEISDECQKAGGKFPIMAQIYTYLVCQSYGVDYEMVFALIERESKCDWNASGDNGTSLGYMQIAAKWHAERMERLNCKDLMNPYQNITVGIDYLAEIQEELQGIPEDVRPYCVLAVYNYGAKGAKENLWNKDVFKYTYNTEIMERAAQLKAEKEKQKAKEE